MRKATFILIMLMTGGLGWAIFHDHHACQAPDFIPKPMLAGDPSWIQHNGVTFINTDPMPRLLRDMQSDVIGDGVGPSGAAGP